MPDPKGEFEAILSNLEAVGFKPNPKTAPWRPDYLAAESSGKYPAWLIGWNCDWLGIDNFLYTAFFGYRGDPIGPNPEFAYKNDEMNQAMVDALDGHRRGRPEGRLGQGPGADPGRHARRAARVEQDARGPADIREGLRPGHRPCSSSFRASGSTSSAVTLARGGRHARAWSPGGLRPRGTTCTRHHP